MQKGLAAPRRKARVIVSSFIKAVKCSVETIVDMAEKTNRRRTGP